MTTDCDSTAQALLVLLREKSCDIAPLWVDQLVSAQAACGGFPTYCPTTDNGAPENGWQVPHPDVTLIVTLLLNRLGGPMSALARAEAWLRAQTLNGIVLSYWWASPAYSAWAQARSGFLASQAAKWAMTALPLEAGIPDLPMLLATAVFAGETDQTSTAAAQLIAQQQSDGSWPCDPCLRVTDPAQCQPSPTAAGRLYAGNRRIFATAHAAAALDEYRRALSHRLAGNAERPPPCPSPSP